jgi:hypothetical protein
MKSVSEKMGIKQDARAILIDAPVDLDQTIGLPSIKLETELTGSFDYIHLFATRQDELHEHLSKMKNHLNQTGAVWVSWPKGGQKGTNLTLPNVIEIGYGYGLVESKCLSVDSTWSALKFTLPKEGKIYNNSYGKLRS